VRWAISLLEDGGDLTDMAQRTHFTPPDHRDWLWRNFHGVARSVAEIDEPLIAAAFDGRKVAAQRNGATCAPPTPKGDA